MPPRPRTAHGALVSIRRLELEDADALLELRLRNREFLEPWEPLREESWYSLGAQLGEVEAGLRAWRADRDFRFAVLREGRLIGRVALTNVVRGAFRNAYLGWFVDQAQGGRGYATDAVRLLVEFAMQDAGLHRVQAAIMPRNTASIRVAEKVGLREEGMAARYLEIRGVWEDHRLFALTREDWLGRAGGQRPA